LFSNKYSNEYNEWVVLITTLPQPVQVKLKGNLENSAESIYYNNFAVQLDLNHKVPLT
jgi:YbbR domain-containing protein